MKKFYFILVLALVALSMGVFFGHAYEKKKTELPLVKASTLYNPPEIITPFHLVDTHGRVFTNTSLEGHWTLVFFGFTRCQMVCPVSMAALKQTYDILMKKEQNPMPQVVFVSVDPEHDTLPIIARYVTSFDPHFQGVTGTQAEIDKFAANLNVLYVKVKGANKAQDSIDHSGAVLLINPDGQLLATFSPPLDPHAIADDFQLIAKDSEPVATN